MKKVVILIIINIVPFMISFESYGFECSSFLFEEGVQEVPGINLSIHKKIYLKVMCSELPRGEHKLSASWVSPAGKVYANDTQTLYVNSDREQVVYFWFKLRRGQSRFIRKFMGTDFQRENYGAWKVLVYSGKDIVTSEEFNLQ